MWVCVVYLENEPRNGFRESREEGQGRNVGSPTHVMEQVAAVGTQGVHLWEPGGHHLGRAHSELSHGVEGGWGV